jgi:hypothetical protein
MRGQSERKQRCGRPAEELCDGVREERSDPTEIPSYIPVAEELRVAVGGKSAGEEDPKEKKYDPANLAGERRARRFIVPVPARAS